MKITGRNIVEEFARKHPQARPRLDNWITHVQNAVWKEPVDVIKTFNSASNLPAREVWVFNIGADRIVASLEFILGTIRIQRIMKHDEYMKWSNK